MGLHHIKTKEDVINEIYRILKPKGKLILIDDYYKNKLRYYFKGILKLIFKGDKRILDHFILSKQENLDLLKDFKIIKEVYLPKLPQKTTQKFMFFLEKA